MLSKHDTAKQLSLVFFMVMLMLFVGCSTEEGSNSILGSSSIFPPPNEVPNLPPTVEKIMCSDDSVCPEDTVTIEVIAHDPEGAELMYCFTTTIGSCNAIGNKAWWAMPEEEGLYKVYVVVSDGLHKVINMVEIDVKDHPLLRQGS